MKKILTILMIAILILSYEKVKADTWGTTFFSNIKCGTSTTNCPLLVSAPSMYGYQYDYTTQNPAKTQNFEQYWFTSTIPNNINMVEIQIMARDPYNHITSYNVSGYITTNLGDTWCTAQLFSGSQGFYTLQCPIKAGATSITALSLTSVTQYYTGAMAHGYVQFGINPVANVSYDTNAIVIEKQQETNEILNQTTTYEGINQSEEINGSEELTSYEQEEQNLLDSLNMTEVDNLDITINPNASSFIWTIVDALRNMSSKIIVFMTSVLGLGVIKMLLNR